MASVNAADEVSVPKKKTAMQALKEATAAAPVAEVAASPGAYWVREPAVLPAWSDWYPTGKTVTRGHVFDFSVSKAVENVLDGYVRFKDLSDAEKDQAAAGGAALQALVDAKLDAAEITYSKGAPE